MGAPLVPVVHRLVHQRWLFSRHLRETELSRAVQNGMVREYVAFDQDEASLAVVCQ
jgi:hypothetical protein